MKTNLFTIADAATMCCGKLNILGSFNLLEADKFPASCGNGCIVLCEVLMEHEDSGDHQIVFEVIDPDGGSLLRSPAHEFSMEVEIGSNYQYVHSWGIESFPMPKPGTFYIDVTVDGRLLARTPLTIAKRT